MTASLARHVDDASSLAVPSAAAADSVAVASWTVLSRLTGLVRIAATGAVLGPTVLGNTFQFTNTLPNLLYYGLLAGSLFSSLLVPALVQHVDAGDRRASARVAGGFLGVTVVALAIVVPVAVALAPVLLGLTTARSVSGDQEMTARLLFLMFVPQVFCYAVVGTASATMNAHRRFGLAAAAPAMENVGIVLVLCLAGLLFPASPSGAVPTEELLLLGLGTTTAVAAHAAVQWWGAHRAGVVLRPYAGWRDPEVVVVIRRALPSLGQAGLLALQVLALLTAANHTPGGVVAFQIAISFVYLAIAVGVTPVALASLPRLARLRARAELTLFHDTFLRGLALGLFLALPAAALSVVLAWPLAGAVSVGRMASAGGSALVAGCLLALAPAILGQAVFQLCTYASYAQHDTRSPLRAAVVQAGTCLAGVGMSLALLHGQELLVGLGAAYSAGTVVGAVSLGRRLAGLLHEGRERIVPSLVRSAAVATLAAAPAWGCVGIVSAVVPGRSGELLAVVVASLVGLGSYLAVQALLHAPELSWVVTSVGLRRRARSVLA